MTRAYFVYIVTNRPRGVLYTGVTNDLERRMAEHKAGAVSGFTSKYGLKRLVWCAEGGDIEGAITLEKKIKNRPRAWKRALVESVNPEWADLSESAADPATSVAGAPSAQDDMGAEQL